MEIPERYNKPLPQIPSKRSKLPEFPPRNICRNIRKYKRS